MMNPDKHYDAIIIGGGPAGLAAGIYLSRAKMKTLIVSEGTVGGQMIRRRQHCKALQADHHRSE